MDPLGTYGIHGPLSNQSLHQPLQHLDVIEGWDIFTVCSQPDTCRHVRTYVRKYICRNLDQDQIQHYNKY